MKAMKYSICILAMLCILLFLPGSVPTRNNVAPFHPKESFYGAVSVENTPRLARNDEKDDDRIEAGLYANRKPLKVRGDTLQIAGSRLPDCSHACGSCSPCQLVMVSFTCARLAEAETCPMAYKCACNRKSFPVP